MSHLRFVVGQRQSAIKQESPPREGFLASGLHRRELHPGVGNAFRADEEVSFVGGDGDAKMTRGAGLLSRKEPQRSHKEIRLAALKAAGRIAFRGLGELDER